MAAECTPPNGRACRSRVTWRMAGEAALVSGSRIGVRRDHAWAESGTIICMDPAMAPEGATVLETERLLLRRWAVADAVVQRQLWAERDPRVPAHRRISVDGSPSLEDLEDRIRDEYVQPRLGLLAAVRKDSREVIGYCGLIANAHGQDDEPELAYEFLRRDWSRGLATEAASAVLEWAESLGYTRLWATIRDWNTASRHVVSKLGFIVTSRIEPNAEHGDSLFYRKDLEPGR